MDKHPREVSEYLKRLVKQQWLIQDGYGRGTRYKLSLSSSEHLADRSEHLASESDQISLDNKRNEQLQQVTLAVRQKGRVPRKLMVKTILQLCADNYLSLKELADILDRKPDSLRNHYINNMVSEGALQWRYPETINHPQQGYKARPRTVKD